MHKQAGLPEMGPQQDSKTKANQNRKEAEIPKTIKSMAKTIKRTLLFSEWENETQGEDMTASKVRGGLSL